MKSYVALDLCFLCLEAKEVVLNRHLRPVLESGVYDQEPCDKCKEYMRQGIILISVKDGDASDNPYRTGIWVVIKEDAFKRMPVKPESLREGILQNRVAFIEDSVCSGLGITQLVKHG